MASLFPTDTFLGFGPTQIFPAHFTPLHAQHFGRKESELRDAVKKYAPTFPGVYGMLDRRGALIYVGKAKRLRHRLMSYFRPGSRDPKAGRILAATRWLVWETCTHEFTALVRELELIRRHRPRFNVIGQPGWRKVCYLCVGRGPVSSLFVARDLTGKENSVHGPFTSAKRLREVIRRLNDYYQLRDCSKRQAMHFAEERDLFEIDRNPGCLRFELGTCLGPCASRCTSQEYSGKIKAVTDFLEGKTNPIESLLQTQMQQAASEMQFERAAAIRDKLLEIHWLTDRLTWLRETRAEHSFIYPLQCYNGQTSWYLIRHGRIQMAIPEPCDVATMETCRKQIDEVYHPNQMKWGGLIPKSQVDPILLISSWFRKHGDEKERCLKPQTASRMLKKTMQKTYLDSNASIAG